MSTLLDMSMIGHTLTGLPERFITAWWAAENGYTWDSATNNPGNISYTPDGPDAPAIPSGGIFAGVKSVLSNRVCVYDTPEHGVQAWAQLLMAPTVAHGGTKLLNVDLEDLTACKGDIKAMAEVIGKSNWAASHYVGPAIYGLNYKGGLIMGAYNSSTLDEWYTIPESPIVAAPAQASKPDPTLVTAPMRQEFRITSGMTLSWIADRTRVPVGILGRYNQLKDPNLILIDSTIRIPERYKIKSGDTLSALCQKWGESVDFIASVNRVDPNRIDAGNILFY